MPIVAFMHTHVLVVILFLILFLIKAAMLFLNKHKNLKKFRNSTKMLDVVFGTLILITDGYLLYNYDTVPAWLWVKVVLVLVAIPVGIAGLKKHNKPLTALALIIFVYVYNISESKNLTIAPSNENKPENNLPGQIPTNTSKPLSTATDAPGTDEAVNKMAGGTPLDVLEQIEDNSMENARAIYLSECAVCHGKDGRKGLGSAPDLTQSKLNRAARKEIIANGKDLMPAYKNTLTDQEIEALAAYSESL